MATCKVIFNDCVYSICLGFVVCERSTALRRKPTTTTASPFSDDNNSETSEECPEPNGFFADYEQCDKYYACL